jgi:Integrator complex subunit 5 N-terminus
VDLLLKETLNHLSKFVRGSSGEQSGTGSSLIKSALLLLQTLPATRQAVLQFIAGLYDNAVKEHFSKLDAQESMQSG